LDRQRVKVITLAQWLQIMTIAPGHIIIRKIHKDLEYPFSLTTSEH